MQILCVRLRLLDYYSPVHPPKNDPLTINLGALKVNNTLSLDSTRLTRLRCRVTAQLAACFTMPACSCRTLQPLVLQASFKSPPPPETPSDDSLLHLYPPLPGRPEQIAVNRARRFLMG